MQQSVCVQRVVFVFADQNYPEEEEERQSALEGSSLELPRGTQVIGVAIQPPSLPSLATKQQLANNSNGNGVSSLGCFRFGSTIEDPKDTVFMNHFPLS